MKKFNGIFELNDEIAFYPGLTTESFERSYLYNGENLDRFFWLRKENQKIMGNSFIIGVLFKETIISQLQLYCVNENITTEEERKRFNDQFVKDFAPEEKYPWGTIQSLVSKREQIALIVVNYK